MDQTTETADLLEIEKYLNTVKEDSETDSDIEEEVANDALLGGIRSGLATITRTARQALSTCKSKTELDDAVEKIEASTLRLLRLEKSFMKTASIVSEVIDDLVSDFEDDQEAESRCSPDGALTSVDKEGSGDATSSANPIPPDNSPSSPPEPYIFRLSEKNIAAVASFKDKLTGELHERFDRYNSGLTDTMLKEDDKFQLLLTQIKLGKTDAENSINNVERKNDKDSESDDDTPFLSSIPYTLEELAKHPYTPYNEDKEMDESVLPTVDPISKNSIVFPLRNKFCNHVFDKNSIYSYITNNPGAKCPMDKCRNVRPLDRSHFIADPVLTTHVQKKNFGC